MPFFEGQGNKWPFPCRVSKAFGYYLNFALAKVVMQDFGIIYRVESTIGIYQG